MAVERVPDQPESHKMTYQQFLDHPHSTEHVEWVDGEVVPMTPVSAEHSLLKTFLLRLVSEFVERHKSGRVFDEPFQTKLGPDLPGRSPDVMFVASGHLSLLTRTYLDGPPDMVVEVVSPESRGRDRGEKYVEYEKAGVPEYWLIDPERRQAEFYLLDEGGIYRLEQSREDERFHSRILPGLWLKLEWLWERPPLDEVRGAWGI